ncbi:MAG: hypothetical protein KGY40_05375 [Thioalkalivibrio sp.]|nr:hypothetical protein [Thioalkalivibrio sp.]
MVQRLDDPAFAEPGDPAREGVLYALLDLYPQPHEAMVRASLRSSDEPDWIGIGEADLDRVLAQDRQAFLENERAEVAARIPDDIHGYLAHWAGFQPGATDPAEDELIEFLEWMPDDLDAAPLTKICRSRSSIPNTTSSPGRHSRNRLAARVPPGRTLPPGQAQEEAQAAEKARKAGRKGK